MPTYEEARNQGFVLNHGKMTMPDGSRMRIMAKRVGDGFYADVLVPMEPKQETLKRLLDGLSA
jgi:hypothetical protein